MQALMQELGKFTPPAITPEREAEVRAFEANERREGWRSRLRDSGIPSMYQDARLGNCDTPIRDYAAAFDGKTRKGLLLTGPYGTGKTYAACALLATLAKTWTVRFAPMTEVVESAATFNVGAMRPYRNAKVLCLDDLGKERSTGFAMEQVYGIIDYRWREGKPTIITTNHDAEGLLAHFTKVADVHTANAIVSRILGMCDVIRLAGVDRRLA